MVTASIGSACATITITWQIGFLYCDSIFASVKFRDLATNFSCRGRTEPSLCMLISWNTQHCIPDCIAETYSIAYLIVAVGLDDIGMIQHKVQK